MTAVSNATSASAASHKVKAADCRHCWGEFKGWQRHECDALTEQLVSVVIGPTIPNLVGIGAAVAIERFKELPQLEQEKWERWSYLMCLGVVTAGVFQLCRRYVGGDTVQIIFDEQDEMEFRAREIFRELRSKMGEDYRAKIASPEFKSSERLAPLQAADLLAYETYKEMNNRTEEPPRSVSKALARLIEGKLHHASYFGRKEILEMRDAAAMNKVDFYHPPTIYNSTLEEKIREIWKP